MQELKQGFFPFGFLINQKRRRTIIYIWLWGDQLKIVRLDNSIACNIVLPHISCSRSNTLPNWLSGYQDWQ